LVGLLYLQPVAVDSISTPTQHQPLPQQREVPHFPLQHQHRQPLQQRLHRVSASWACRFAYTTPAAEASVLAYVKPLTAALFLQPVPSLLPLLVPHQQRHQRQHPPQHLRQRLEAFPLPQQQGAQPAIRQLVLVRLVRLAWQHCRQGMIAMWLGAADMHVCGCALSVSPPQLFLHTTDRLAQGTGRNVIF
jgi:hypothetical protein